jgi:hypothetical protein
MAREVTAGSAAAARYVATIGYSATFFFHWIPAITETSTRLPPGAPLAANADVPGMQMAAGFCFVLFLVGAFFQAMRLRAASAGAPGRLTR